MKSINTVFRKLTFEDLQDWAGETILNRGKGYVKRVDQLSRTEDNTLVAWVTGSERYATSARVDEAGDFEYFCTCPYDLHYLETGQHPVYSQTKGKKSGWPLPSPEVEPPSTCNRRGYQRFPDNETLIDITIMEKNFDDVVDLYQRLRKTRRWGRETERR